MQHWSALLTQVGTVRAFDYPYMLSGSHRPDPLPRLIAAHRAAVAAARASHSGPVVLVGKSMGSRIGCHVSLQENVHGLICFGYPLCGGGDPARMRDKVLREIQAPVLFVQGTRDPLCPLDLLQGLRSEMKAPNELHVVDGGDHSLQVGKRSLRAAGLTQSDVDAVVLAAVRSFLATHLGNTG